MNHPNRSQQITINVKRLYDCNMRPSGVWNVDAERACTDDELRRAAKGELRMVEARYIAGHASYGRHAADGPNWPSTSTFGDAYTLTPGNIAEFIAA